MKKGSSRRDEGKERQWREVIGRQAGSGLSVRAFCLQAGIKESAFYFWRRELKKREQAGRVAQAVRLSEDDGEKTDAGGGELFVPVVTKALPEPAVKNVNELTGVSAGGNAMSETTAAVEMILPSGSVLRWFGDDATSTIDWIAALEARLC